MQAAWLLAENPDPDEAEIREGISGNLCRCTGYVNIVKAIQQAAGELSAAESAPVVAAETVDGQASPPNLPRPAEGSDDMTTETERELRTSPEIGGMGHSVKRKEDPRFIRGQGEYIEDVNLPGQLWLDIVRSPYAHATIKSIDATEALKIPGVAAVVTGKDLEGYKLHWMPTLAGDMQMVLPVDTVMYQSQEVAAVIATSRYAAADGVAAVARRLRAAAGHRRPAQGARARRVRPPARPRTGQAEQPHLALGIGRPGRRRRRARGRRGDRSSRTSTSRASTSPRSRRAAASPTGTRSASSSRCT